MAEFVSIAEQEANRNIIIDRIKDNYQLQEDLKQLSQQPLLTTLLEAMPELGMILDDQRRIVMANHKLLTNLGMGGLGTILGARPGEALACIHAYRQADGCGQGLSCRYCGVVQTVKACLATQQASQQDSRITFKGTIDGPESFMDFRVRAVPLNVEDRHYVAVSMVDVSDQKRRSVLERIFFHDVLNIAGGLNGLVHYIRKNENADENRHLLEDVEQISKAIIEEIQAQREVQNAEDGALEVRLKAISLLPFLESILSTVRLRIGTCGQTLGSLGAFYSICLLTPWRPALLAVT